MILSLSIISCLWVLIAIFHRKYDRRGQRHYAERRRRHRYDSRPPTHPPTTPPIHPPTSPNQHSEIRKFLDFTVTVLLSFELWQSINWLVGSILSEQLYGRSTYGTQIRREMSTREFTVRPLPTHPPTHPPN